MVRTLQIKFVKTAMTAISVLLLAVICAISGIYSFDTYRKEKNTAEMLADSGGIPDFVKMKRDRQEGFEPGPHDMQRPEGTDSGNPFFGNKMSPDDVMAVRYFIIRYDTDGGIESADTGSIYSVTDEEAEEYGRQVIAGGRQSGIIGNFMYYLNENEEGKTVAFVDVSSQISSILSVIVISLIIAAIAWILMFVFVSALSRRAIAPIAENIVRQKQFVTNAGHELKTPLAIIMANTEALELFNGETKWTRNIRAQTIRLSGLMQNLLTLSRMDENSLNLEKKVFALYPLAGEVWENFAEPASGRNLSFRIIYEEKEDAKVLANRESIAQLLSILFDNAVKYTPRGGEIEVQIRTAADSVRLIQSNTVSETDGAGEIAEDPDRLFERFYRTDADRSRKKGGYGIGLSAARAIAAANSGTISAKIGDGRIVFTVNLKKAARDRTA